MITCKFCKKSANQIKAGYSKSGKQRYKCKDCLRTYTSSQTVISVESHPLFNQIHPLTANNVKSDNYNRQFTSLEICAGGGGQALGLEQAGFHHIALVEIDTAPCETLKLNRPNWNVIQTDLKKFDATPFMHVDLLSGGVPCPPFSVASKQLGIQDERNLFDEAVRLISECQPKAVLLENVRGLLDRKFSEYRTKITKEVESQGYKTFWTLINASDYGVPQLRIRTVCARP